MSEQLGNAGAFSYLLITTIKNLHGGGVNITRLPVKNGEIFVN